MKKVITFVSLIMLALSCFISCNQNYGNETKSFNDNFDSEKYEENQALWKSKNLQNYEFSVEIDPLGFMPGYKFKCKTVVKNGKTDSITTEYNTEVSEDEETSVKDVQYLFDYIMSEFNLYSNDTEQYEEIIFYSQKYNEEYGYPEYIKFSAITREKPEPGFCGQFCPIIGFNVTDFKILDE